MANLNCLQYYHENGYVLTRELCSILARESGHLNCFKYICKNKCQWDNYVCTVIAVNGVGMFKIWPYK